MTKRRTSKRGGARPVAVMGRPVTTGSKKTKPIFFRVSAAERARAEEIASARDSTPNEIAKQAFLREIRGVDANC